MVKSHRDFIGVNFYRDKAMKYLVTFIMGVLAVCLIISLCGIKAYKTVIKNISESQQGLFQQSQYNKEGR